jgi:hypothetical protein
MSTWKTIGQLIEMKGTVPAEEPVAEAAAPKTYKTIEAAARALAKAKGWKGGRGGRIFDLPPDRVPAGGGRPRGGRRLVAAGAGVGTAVEPGAGGGVGADRWPRLAPGAGSARALAAPRCSPPSPPSAPPLPCRRRSLNGCASWAPGT